MIIYAVGDVHGQYKELSLLLDKIQSNAEKKDEKTVFIQVGDLVDRGPNSKKVLDTMRAIESKLPAVDQHEVLLGNHELDLLAIINNEHPDPHHWYKNKIGRAGGRATLKSFGVDLGDDPNSNQIVQKTQSIVPNEYVAWIKKRPVRVIKGSYYFVHAGINPSIPLNQQDSCDCLYMREPFLSSDKAFEYIIVHGHTPAVNSKAIHQNRINVDTGAGHNQTLSAFILPEQFITSNVKKIQIPVDAPGHWLEPDQYEEETRHINPPVRYASPEKFMTV